MRRLPFVTVDVFARRPLEGNPLAVFPEGRDLAESELLAIAREFNLSETTFVFRRGEEVERARGIRVRIFSTHGEMPFAGHPTLGTAAVLREQGAGDAVTLELNVGPVTVRFSERDGRSFGEMTQIDPTFGMTHDPRLVAEATGLAVDDFLPGVPIQTVSTGIPFAILPFARLQTLQDWTPEGGRLERYLQGTDAKHFFAISRETVSESAQLHARMPFYGGEDPATGSAAGTAVAWMVRHGLTPAGSVVEIEQGLEVHRPSRLYCRADLAGANVVNVRVGGFFTRVLQGELVLP